MTSRFGRKELDLRVLDEAKTDKIAEWGLGNFRAEIECLFLSEIRKSDHGHAYDPADSELLGAMEKVIDPTLRGNDYSFATIIKALGGRAKIQSGFLSVFMHLHKSGLLSLEGLQRPVNLGRFDDKDVWSLTGVLGCFHHIREITQGWNETINFDLFLVGLDVYTAPLLWLARLIARGALISDLYTILDCIEDYGEFGTLDRQKIERVWATHRKLVRNPTSGLIQPLTGSHDWPVLAFWLPHNLGDGNTMEVIYEEFDERVFIPLEDIFFQFFGIENNSRLANEMLSASFLKKKLRTNRKTTSRGN